MFVYKYQLDNKKAKTGSFSQGKGITFKTYTLLHCFPTCWVPCSDTKQSRTVLTHNIGIPFLLHKRWREKIQPVQGKKQTKKKTLRLCLPSWISVAEAGERLGGGRPPSPFRPETCLRLKFLHRQARISLFNWLNFLNETAYRILPLNWIRGIFKNFIVFGYPPVTSPPLLTNQYSPR